MWLLVENYRTCHMKSWSDNVNQLKIKKLIIQVLSGLYEIYLGYNSLDFGVYGIQTGKNFLLVMVS